jgi:hypothetical protein
MSDLKKIIHYYPDEHPKKNRDLSLFSFAHKTGARAISCSAVKISDIALVMNSVRESV